MPTLPILDLLKSTSDGRFRVTIESFKTGDGEDRITVEDAARSLNELGGILNDASLLAIQLSCRLLDEQAAVNGTPTDPRRS